MTIREFINSLDRTRMVSSNWREILREHGYYSVVSDHITDWADMHQWCEQHIGENLYTWTGEIFWFDREKDAIMFALRWS